MRRRVRMSRGGRRGRAPVAWVNAVANHVAVPVDGTLLELGLLEPADWGGDIVNTNKKGHLIRTIGSWTVLWVPETTTFATGLCRLFWAVYVIDQDDADATIVSAAVGTILQGSRVLQVGCTGFSSLEIPTANQGTAFIPALTFSWDTALRAKLESDQIVALGVQLGGGVTGTITSMGISGYSRSLIREP